MHTPDPTNHMFYLVVRDEVSPAEVVAIVPTALRSDWDHKVWTDWADRYPHGDVNDATLRTWARVALAEQFVGSDLTIVSTYVSSDDSHMVRIVEVEVKA